MNEYLYVVQKIEKPVDDLLIIKISPSKGGKVFAYKPGQYVMIAIRNSSGKLEEKHAFSIASTPTNTDELELGIRIGGRFTRELAKALPGTEILVYGPYGAFSFNENKHKTAVFLAGGIGITPFLSAIRYANAKGLSNDLTLIYSNRTLTGTAFYDELNGLTASQTNLKTYFSVTNDATLPNVPGVIKERLNASHLQNIIQNPLGKNYFLCGPPLFMAGMKKNLIEIGVPEDKILMEEFAMISSQPMFLKIKHFANIFGYSAAAVILPFYLIYLANAKPNNATLPAASVPVDLETVANEELEPVDNNPDAVEDLQGSVSDNASVATSELSVIKQAGVAVQKTGTSVAPKTRIVNIPTVNKGQALNTSKTVTTPKPVTTSSVPVNESKPATAQPTTPSPTTGASGAPAANTASATSGTTPTPTTGASTAATGGVASGGTQATTQQREDDDD